MSPQRIKAYSYLLVVTFIWAAAGPIMKYTLQGIDPETFLLYRFFIASCVGVAYIFIKRPFDKAFKKHWKKVVIYSLLATTFSLGFLFLGLDRTTVLDLNILGSITPLLVVIAGAIVFKEKVSNQEKFGASIAFLGTLLAVVTPFILMKETGFQFSGNLLLMAHICSDIAALLIAKELLKKGVSSGILSNLSFVIGFATIAPFVLLVSSTPSEVINKVIYLPIKYQLGVWYMAILSGTVAYYLRNQAQKHVSVGETGLFGYLNPVFSAPIAVLWLGEVISTPFIIGAILVVIGVVIAEAHGITRKKVKEKIPHVIHHK